MSALFALLFLLSILCFLIGIIKPSLFSKFSILSRKRAALVFGALIILSFFLLGSASQQQNTTNQQIKTVAVVKTTITPVPTICPTDTTKDYKVIGCAILPDKQNVPYRLIEAVIAPANANETQTKNIANEIKKNDCGKSCSIDILDNTKIAEEAFIYNKLKTDAQRKQYGAQHPDFRNGIDNDDIASIDDTNNSFFYLPLPTDIPDTQSNDNVSTPVQVPPTVQTQQNTGLSNNNYYTNVNGNQVHSPAYSTNGQVPSGATAQCNDGTYSFSQHHSGTCSGHGGVAQWL